MPKQTMLKLWKIVLLILIVIIFSSCSNNDIIIEASFPVPLVKQHPFTVGIVYEEVFQKYHYEQEGEEKGESDWSLKTGKAQVALFNRLLDALFKHTVVLDSYPDSIPETVNVIFYPLVEDIQIAIPAVTKINVFEVWIRFNLRMYTPQGELVADWIMSGYGKTPTKFLKTQAQAIEQATILALRDSGANFVVGFEKVPEVKQWLEEQADNKSANLAYH